MFNIEFDKEDPMKGYLYPQPEQEPEEEELLYDEYYYEIYRAMLGYMEPIE
jgi:hypothetical protein